MVPRYILAFVLSIALVAFWVSLQPPPSGKGDNGAVEKNTDKDKDKDKKLPPEKSGPGDLEPGEPEDPQQKRPGDSEETEKTGQEVAQPGIKLAWKDGLGSLDRILRDGKEIASFPGSTGGLGLSIALGEDDFIEVSEGWKELADEPAAKGPAWNHRVEVGDLEITRRITLAPSEAGVSQQFALKLDFRNKSAGEVRYRIRGPSFSAGAGDRQVAASRVDKKVESRAVVPGKADWQRKGEAKWIALRHFGRLAILSSDEELKAALVDATGTVLEGLAGDGSAHQYSLAFGSNEPGALESYGVGRELSVINRTREKFVPERFEVTLDSGRGGISGVSLLNFWTAVEGDPERKIQPLLENNEKGPVLLSMGSISGKQEDDEKEGWSGPWKEKFVPAAEGAKEIIFEKQVGDVLVRKKLSLALAGEFDDLVGTEAGNYADNYLLRVSIELTNTSDKKIPGPYHFRVYGPCAISTTSTRWVGADIQFAYGTNYKGGSGVKADIYDLDEIPTLTAQDYLAWMATVNSYFTTLMFPAERQLSSGGEILGIATRLIPYPSPGASEDLKKVQSLLTAFRCQFEGGLWPGKKRKIEFGLYLGPRFSNFIEAGDKLNLEGANDLGMTSPLIHFFMGILHLLHTITLGEWGWAIILLTVLVKICLHPITRKNQRGMMRMGKVMAKIKPEMDALKEKYPTDRVKHSQEVQKLWKKHNVNPAKQMLGCLVIFLQMPIWIGIIWSLDYTIELRQASFLYIDDLTKPDMLFRFPGGIKIPFLGEHFNLLPVLYVILTLVNQKLQPRSKDPQAAAQQKMMGFMMIFFGFIFYNFAGGFMLYIMTSAALGIAESKIIKAQLAKEDLEEEGAVADSAPQEPLYPAKNKSAGQRVVPSSAKKKKKRRKNR